MTGETDRLQEFIITREVRAITMEAKGRKRLSDQAIVNVTITASEKETKEVRYRAAFRKPAGKSHRKIEAFNREQKTKEGWDSSKDLHIPSAWFNPMAHWAYEILLRS